MTRIELLEEMQKMTYHNLLCYSSNYMMNSAKSGYENEWNRENEKAKLLQEMITEEKKREKNRNKDKER